MVCNVGRITMRIMFSIVLTSGVASQKFGGGNKFLGGAKCLILGE